MDFPWSSQCVLVLPLMRVDINTNSLQINIYANLRCWSELSWVGISACLKQCSVLLENLNKGQWFTWYPPSSQRTQDAMPRWTNMKYGMYSNHHLHLVKSSCLPAEYLLSFLSYLSEPFPKCAMSDISLPNESRYAHCVRNMHVSQSLWLHLLVHGDQVVEHALDRKPNNVVAIYH